MRKIVFQIIFFLIIPVWGYSQEDCSLESSQWIWYDNSEANWEFKKQGGGSGNTYSVWSTTHKNVPEIGWIYKKEDYLPKHGWVLLYKNFGCDGGIDYPYFMLYNKYRGVIRVFTYLNTLAFPENSNGGLINLEWNKYSKTTSLLTHNNKLSLVNNRYHSSDGTILDSDIGTVFLRSQENSWYRGYFCVADFNVAFDHLTPVEVDEEKGIYPGDYELFFELTQIKTSTLQMNGTFDFITHSYSGNIDKTEIEKIDKDSDGNIDFKKYLTDAKNLAKSIPSESDLKKVFGDQKNELLKYQQNSNASFGNTKISEKYEFSIVELEEGSNFVNFLTGVSKYAPIASKYLDAGIKVFDFFSGKSNPTPQKVEIMPTISKGKLDISGEITTEANGMPVRLELPGTPHFDSDITPYYDCPLGVISLEEEPSIKVRKWEETKYKYNFTSVFEVWGTKEDPDYDGDGFRSIPYSENICRYIAPVNNVSTIEKWKSVKVNSDLKVAINHNADVTLKELKAAIVCEIKRQSNDKENEPDKFKLPAYDLKPEQEIPKEAKINSNVHFVSDYTVCDNDALDNNCHGGYESILLYDELLYRTNNKFVDIEPSWSYRSGNTLNTAESFNSKRWLNKTLTYLNDGVYSLDNITEEGLATFSTPFIDVEYFKNTSVTVREETDVYLKLFAVMEANDPSVSSTPIIWSASYKLTGVENENDNSSDLRFPFTRAQLKDNESADPDNITILSNKSLGTEKIENWAIETEGNVTINENSHVNFNAINSITLKPGFTVKSNSSTSFKASIINENAEVINSNYTPLENIVTPYFDNVECQPSNLKSAKMYTEESFEGLLKEMIQSSKPALFPNPVDNQLNFSNVPISNDSEVFIKIFDTYGRLVYNGVIMNTNFSLDVSNYPKGLFLTKLYVNNKVYDYKFIKK